MWFKRCLKFNWLRIRNTRLSLTDILWCPVYAAVFLKIKGDSIGTFGTYVWVSLLTLTAVGCLRQVYFLWLDPDKQLKGLASFPVTVSFTRLLAACLIFFGANWPPKGHLFEHIEPNWGEHSGLVSDTFVGLIYSVSSGHVASTWLKPLGILMAFWPFWRTPATNAGPFYSRLFRGAVFLGLAVILSLLLMDQLLVHSLVWIAIYGINRSWSLNAWPPEAAQSCSSMGEVEQASFAAVMMVVVALVALGFVFAMRPMIRVLTGIISVALLILATYSAWHIRMELVPSVSPTFRMTTEPMLPVALLLMGLVAIPFPGVTIVIAKTGCNPAWSI